MQYWLRFSCPCAPQGPFQLPTSDGFIPVQAFQNSATDCKNLGRQLGLSDDFVEGLPRRYPQNLVRAGMP
jgi:hypothetical protein